MTVVSVTQEASLATITFAEDITINLGEGDNKSDTETDFFNMSIPNIGTADPTYDYSKLEKLGQLQEYLDFQSIDKALLKRINMLQYFQQDLEKLMVLVPSLCHRLKA